MIVKTGDGSLYSVSNAGEGLEHVWLGVPVKRAAGGYVAKANASPRLVRKAGAVEVEA